jgi:hypothetical protein|uniref:Uncharacterized protein n=1 Tax=viral metagenome TaxID=1070528 RepID=A0A6C0IR19_9ZZZZ
MVKILLIQKTGELKNSNLNSVDLELLYKKAGFRNGNNFGWRACWPHDNSFISLYCRDSGRESTINKYDLPPPIDTNLFYGTLVCIKHDKLDIKDSTVFSDLTVVEWENCYNKLFGGFEDLNNEDSYSDEEEIPAHLQTKEGYSKEDGFIVSDEDECADYVDDDDAGDDEDDDNLDDGEDDNLAEHISADSDESDDDEDSDELEYESEANSGSELSYEEYLSDD